ANALTTEIAELLGSQPVITTATDINGVFAVDLWAKANGLLIGNMEKARDISMRLLRGEEVFLESEYPIAGKIPSSLLRFAHKTQKNRLSADFLPCKLRKQPDNRGFFAASSAKNPQVQQAASVPTLMKLAGFPREGTCSGYGTAQGIKAEIPQASSDGAEELERIARFFAAFQTAPQKMRPNL
ncbi:MAG: hypothetical protein LBP20_00725, partial [Treponema sp.]|nr:hypothetical protein [Treponema sp.]